MNINLRMQNTSISLLQRQIFKNKILNEQFKNYTHDSPRIRTIPVGSHQLIYPQEPRMPFSIITASRLASENMWIG